MLFRNPISREDSMLALSLSAGLVLASFLPPPVAPSAQGHQVTPKITDYVVIQKGQQYLPGQNYGNLLTPSVQRVGSGFDVAFFAALTGSPAFDGVFVDRNVTSTSSLPPTLVFGKGDTLVIPGLAGGNPVTVNNISLVVPPALGAGGHVAQGSTVTGVGISPTTFVLFLRGPGLVDPLKSVCYQGQPIAGGAGGVFALVTLPFALTAGAEVGFHATVTGGTAIAFADSLQALQIVARTSDPAPGTNDLFNLVAGVTNNEFAPCFDSAGRSAFRASTDGLSASGVWVEDSISGMSWIADQTTTAPQTGGLPFRGFKAPATASSGIVAFRGCLNNSCTNDGVWRFNGQTLSLVAMDLSAAPDPDGDTPLGGDVFSGFSNPAVNVAGDVYFRAEIQSGTEQGIWRWHANGIAGLRRVVRSGDALRGSNVTFSTFGSQIALAESGQIAFTAVMSDNKQGLFVTSELGSIVKIAKVGDLVPVVGPQKETSAIQFYPGSSSQGNGGYIQNVGLVPDVAAIAYTLSFTDGGQAVLLTTLE